MTQSYKPCRSCGNMCHGTYCIECCKKHHHGNLAQRYNQRKHMEDRK